MPTTSSTQKLQLHSPTPVIYDTDNISFPSTTPFDNGYSQRLHIYRRRVETIMNQQRLNDYSLALLLGQAAPTTQQMREDCEETKLLSILYINELENNRITTNFDNFMAVELDLHQRQLAE